MADIPGDTGIGLDIRHLISGTSGDIVGVFPSGTFNTTIDNVIEVSGAIFTDGDLTGSVNITAAPVLEVSGGIFTGGDIVGSVNILTSLPSIGSFTTQNVSTPADHYINRIAYSGAMNVPVYIGLATPGTAVGDAGWQIKQLSYGTNSMVSGILFASGNTVFDKHWDARTSGPYS